MGFGTPGQSRRHRGAGDAGSRPTRHRIAGTSAEFVPHRVERVFVHGVDEDALATGVGRYPTAPPPGRPGNFALAGHRTANGEPFADIDELAAGDVVIVRTRNSTNRYRLIDDVVVEPDETWVIGDVTKRLDLDADTPVISLVTCSPKWSTEKRWVWWGALIDEA